VYTVEIKNCNRGEEYGADRDKQIND
jgi:hypothetical protein